MKVGLNLIFFSTLLKLFRFTFICVFSAKNFSKKSPYGTFSSYTKSRYQEGKTFKFPTSLFSRETKLRRRYTFSGGFFLAEGDLTETEVGEEIFLDEELFVWKRKVISRFLISKRKQPYFSYFGQEGLWYGVVELQLKALDLLLPWKKNCQRIFIHCQFS